MSPRRWIQLGVAFLAAAFVLWAGYFIFRSSFVATDGRRYFSLFDDAMISMRYAWNLSHGMGLVWNLGERIEGYTNILMVIWMAIWTGVLDKSSAVLAVQLSGIPVLLGIALLGMLHWLELARGQDVLHRGGYAAIAFAGCLLYYPLAYWTLMGMETGLLTLLLLSGTFLLLVHMRTGRLVTLAAAAVALGLAYGARPDSAPLATLSLGAATLLGSGARKRRASLCALAFAIYLAFPLLQTAFRSMYYDSLVPLTYTLKMTGMPFKIRLENGLGFTRLFLGQAGWAYGFAVGGLFLRFSRRKALLLIPPLALVIYQVLIGGDAWTYWRLVAPGVPYLILLALSGVDSLVHGLARVASQRVSALMSALHKLLSRSVPRSALHLLLPLAVALASATLLLGGLMADLLRPGSPGFGFAQRYLVGAGVLLAFAASLVWETPLRHWAAFTVTILLLLSLNRPFLDEATLFDVPYQVWNNKNHVDAALSINRLTTEDASVGVIWAGIIPYYTSRYAIDFLGKNDPYIANLPADVSGSVGWGGMFSVPGHNKYDLYYSILRRRPTYVEGFSWGSQDLSPILKNLYVEVSSPGPDPAFLRSDPAVRWETIPADKLLPP